MSHITSCEIDHEHHVDFVSHTWYLAVPFSRLPCPSTKRHVMLNLTSTGVCNTGTSALYVCNLLLWLTTNTTTTYTEGLQFFTLGSSMSPQIYTASDVHAFLFEMDPDIIPRVTYHIMWDRSWTSCGWFRIIHLAVPDIIFSAYHTVQFFRLQKIKRKIACCCIRRCSLVLSASSTKEYTHPYSMMNTSRLPE